MITVVCVYWKGEFRNRGYYSEEWVQRLQYNIQRTLSEPHRFVCLSNVELKTVETIPLKHNWPGWWSKMEMFRKDIPGDRFIHLDLATLPIQNIDALINFDGPLIFSPPNLYKFTKNVKHARKFMNGLMVWDKNYLNRLYEKFIQEDKIQYHIESSQVWMEKTLNEEKIKYKTFPESWVRTLRDVNNISENIKAIHCSPGAWKPNLVVKNKGKRYQWVNNYWKGGKL